MLVALPVYRPLDRRGFVEAVQGAVRTTVMVLLVIGALIAALLAVTYIPALSLWLPPCSADDSSGFFGRVSVRGLDRPAPSS